jgi:CD109 antigen
MDGGMENLYAMAAYVTNALADYVHLAPPGVEPDPAVLEGLEKAATYLDPNLTTLAGAEVWNDPYSLSIAAVGLPKVAGHEAGAEAILDRLLELAVTEGIGIHWEPYPVETTGYAAMALLESNGGAGRPEASAAIEWLSAQRNALGGYGQSTQDTVVAIRALFLAARKVHRDLDVTLRLLADGETLETLHINESNYDLFHQIGLPLSSSEAPQAAPQLELVSEGSGSVGYQVVKRYNVPGDMLPPSRDMILDVVYDSSHIEVDDIVDVRVSLQYTGAKEETGMVIADIGVPTGFSAVRTSLDALVAAETVSRVEVAGRKVIFYIDSLESGVPLTFAFQVLALYPVRAEGTTAHAYEYYDSSVEAFDGQGVVTISERTHAPGVFVRGDSNEDGEVNLSDAVNTLNHLFLGGPRPPCMDAADSDDDGVVNITDPIYLLQFLFLGGVEPPPPFPEAGPDSTEDGLDC